MEPDPSHPHVSVILIVRNGERHIGRQLEALGRQQNAPAFEVIVVDNGSTDSTAAIVSEWINALPSSGPSARLVDASDKPSIPYARNQGALASKAPLLAFCDADDAVEAHWVRAIKDGMVQVDLVGGSREAYAENGERRPALDGEGLNQGNYLPFVPGCNFAVTRQCYFDVGGFDESLPPYGFDDVEFSWRVQLAGRRIESLPAARVRYTVSGSVDSVRKVFLLSKGRVLVAHRYPPFDPRPYSLGFCTKDALRAAARVPGGVLRARGPRAPELREVVSAAGRLWGFVNYELLKKRAQPLLLSGDPFGRR